ncbi:patatin-like phospholipase family protein [Rhodococcus sp. NPDC058505]|uniref:patatin-like phospholipase family protein n=1 Tax=Rhodococcus sp. NPDC058505 TaxID=3346531 RepID=UPI003646003A
MTAELRADLVCEGGGVRGIGLVGAVDALAEAGYSFPRIAGSSAGAIVAALAAALQRAGEPLTALREIIAGIDYRKFEDTTLLGKIPLVGGVLSLVTTDGVYQGDYLEKFLGGILDDLGVRTFGDLRTGDVSERHGWALVVAATDLSRRRLVRIPWDLPGYGVDADEFPVARAVRASSAIPFLFAPVRVRGATWVDGGLLANFPIDLFDRERGAARWPTFGIRLSAPPGVPPTHPVRGPLSLGLALGIAAVGILFGNQDAAYVDDPCTVRRTVFVPSGSVSPIDFRIDAAKSAALYESGVTAGREFVEAWDWAAFRADCVRAGSGARPARRTHRP